MAFNNTPHRAQKRSLIFDHEDFWGFGPGKRTLKEKSYGSYNEESAEEVEESLDDEVNDDELDADKEESDGSNNEESAEEDEKSLDDELDIEEEEADVKSETYEYEKKDVIEPEQESEDTYDDENGEQEASEPEHSGEEEEDEDVKFWQGRSLSLTSEQKEVFDYVRSLLTDMSFRRNNPTSVCIQGSAGTGKTEVLKCLFDYVETYLHTTAIYTASSGVAASKRRKGRTGHSMFGYPFMINFKNQLSNVSVYKIDEILKASLIVYDEVNMVDKKLIEMLDRTLRSMMRSKTVFGGKIVVFAGDFRQVTPVNEDVFFEDECETSLKSSSLWTQIKKIELSVNLRTKHDPSFTRFLNNLSCGRLPSIKINNSSQFYVPLKNIKFTTDEQELEQFVYPEKILNDPEQCARRAILVSKNQTAKEINKRILKSVDGPGVTVSAEIIQTEYSQRLNLDKVVPEMNIKLKKGCLCTLIRNYYIQCNNEVAFLKGTRVIVDDIGAEILYVRKPGSKSIFPMQMQLFKTSKHNEIVTFYQYPLEVAYAISIFKSQSLTFDRIGVNLEGRPKHGRLYMALSRVRSKKDLMVLVEKQHVLFGTAYAANIVHESLV